MNLEIYQSTTQGTATGWLVGRTVTELSGDALSVPSEVRSARLRRKNGKPLIFSSLDSLVSSEFQLTFFSLNSFYFRDLIFFHFLFYKSFTYSSLYGLLLLEKLCKRQFLPGRSGWLTVFKCVDLPVSPLPCLEETVVSNTPNTEF